MLMLPIISILPHLPAVHSTISHYMRTGHRSRGELQATDRDGDQVTYELLDTDSRSFHLFMVEPDTGSVKVKNSLLEGYHLTYTLGARDNGEPQSSVKARILVTVVRNPNGPVFVSSYNNKTIGEYTPIRNAVVNIKAEDADPADTSNGRVRYTECRQILRHQSNVWTDFCVTISRPG